MNLFGEEGGGKSTSSACAWNLPHYRHYSGGRKPLLTLHIGGKSLLPPHTHLCMGVVWDFYYLLLLYLISSFRWNCWACLAFWPAGGSTPQRRLTYPGLLPRALLMFGLLPAAPGMRDSFALHFERTENFKNRKIFTFWHWGRHHVSLF